MKSNFNVLIAPDSFKESLTAQEVCNAIESGLREVQAGIKVQKVPLADGGEGTMQSIVDAKEGRIVQCTASDPLMRSITTEYGIIEEESLAIIEMAKISGLELLRPAERDPRFTTTYGTGELIRNALDKGCRKFIIGIGGSATNDGGAGMLEALGVQLLNKEGIPVPKGGGGLGNLQDVRTESIDPRVRESTISVACDVTNPLLGENGATRVFGRQKGADDTMITRLENNLSNYAEILEDAFGKTIADVPGSGAAGGLGAGLLALPNCTLKSGFEIVKELLDLEQKIEWADLIFTGEGKTDSQTQYGKVPYGVAQIAQKKEIPVICLSGTHGSGTTSLNQGGISAIFSILDAPMSLETAMQKAPELLKKTTEQVLRLFLIQNPLSR